MDEIREVYVKIGAEIKGKTPKEFIEHDFFWKTHKTDEGYVMLYLDKNNQIMQ